MTETDKSPIIGRRTVLPSHQVNREPATHVRKQEPTPIILRRKVDFRELDVKETKSLVDTLPTELQEVLDDLSPNVPQEWRQQAVEAAHYINSLDSSQEITDENGQSLVEKRQRFTDQLANSGFVWGVYNRSSRWALDPTKSLPNWLHSRKDLQKFEQLSDSEQEVVSNFYKEYVAKHATIHTSDDGQKYYDFTNGVPNKGKETITGVHRSKGYVEETSLRNVQVLEKTLEALRKQKIHPHTTKLFDRDRLVLYWDSELTDEQKSQIESVFDQKGIEFRAFGQDVPEVILTNDRYQVDSRASNDSSLGDGGHNPFRWDDPEYNSAKFLRQYLQMTYWGCKDPTEPYRVSFAPIITQDVNIAENADRIKELQQSIEASDHLPTVVTARSYLNCFEKLN